jgi:predicted phosphoribosyltransferase
MAKIRIVSHMSERFLDRHEAGRLLAAELAEYRGQQAVVLGIPRGGIIVARELARALDAELDVVLAHKLRTPGHGELAMGSVAEDGRLFLNEDVVRDLAIDGAYIQREKEYQLGEIKHHIEQFRRVRPKVPLEDRTAIVTDDGVATGATTQAALWAVRLEQPRTLIAALPVGPGDTIRRLAEDVDQMVCLRTPPYFSAVGQFYIRFYPVEDREVLEILEEERDRAAGERGNVANGRTIASQGS